MNKNKYYVSVQAGTVIQDRGASGYEFDIEATPKEADQLLELMETGQDEESKNFIRAGTPYIPYHNDKENDVHDEHLKHVYQVIYTLGTAETKNHIEKMKIL